MRTHPVHKLLEQHCYKSAAGLLQLVRFCVYIHWTSTFEICMFFVSCVMYNLFSRCRQSCLEFHDQALDTMKQQLILEYDEELEKLRLVAHKKLQNYVKDDVKMA